MIALLWSRFSAYLWGVAGILLAIAEVYRRGRKSGIEKIEREQEAARQKSIQARKDIDNDVARASSSDVDNRLSRWVRDK